MAMVARIALFLLATGFGAQAQQVIQGRVTDRTSGMPVAGVVVSAVDAQGNPVSRAVSDSVSGYRIAVAPGAVKLQFRRIAFAPVEAALRDTVNGRIDVVLTRLPTVLPEVKALATAQCNADANSGAALALWEQARSGMLTSIVARESKAAWISILTYETSFNGDDEDPRSVNRIELASASNAFLAGGDPDSLAQFGYGSASLVGTTFLGPDDVVLFGESFLATHCFRLGESTDSTLSLEFEPAKGRNKLIEINGSVLFRREPLDLKSVVYQYTGVRSPLDRARPGGALYFERMPSGITMIQRWHIRGAFAVLGGGSSSISSREPVGIIKGRGGRGAVIRTAPRGSGSRVAVQATESGALIELMKWSDAPPFLYPLGRVSGILIDKYSKRPLANTPVRFYRTPYRTTTDSTGAYTLDDVLPGIYEVDAGDFDLERYGAAPALIPVTVRYGANKLDLDGEGPEAAVVRGCGEKVDGRLEVPRQLAGKNAIFGMVSPTTTPLKEIEFRAEVMPAGMVAGTPGLPLKGKTDKAGRFRICGLPSGTVKLWSRVGSLSATDSVVVDPLHPYRLVTLQMGRRP
jgi:hypothetical protein